MKLTHLTIAAALTFTQLAAHAADYLNIQLKDGSVVIELTPQTAPQSVQRLEDLAREGQYDNVAFHRVIDGFMAQTGDVQFGKMDDSYDAERVGTGQSNKPDLPAEFSSVHFDRGVVGMARAANPNSGNSQFFIMFAPGYFLDGQYTVVGKVVSGMDLIDKIKRGEGESGAVINPDQMVKVTVKRR